MDIITKLLDRIPTEYSTVHVAMALVGTDRQNLDTVKRLLLSEELRLGQINRDSEDALYIKKNKQNKSLKTTKESQSKDKKWKCYTCGDIGHFKRDCPTRKDRKGGKGCNKISNNKDDISGNVCFNCIEAAMIGSKDDKILADSGASCHMFNDISWFMEIDKKTETLNLAGKCQLNSAGRGTVAAEAWVDGNQYISKMPYMYLIYEET